MLDFIKPLKLPPQLVWRFSHEPELLAWKIRARNYNTLLMNFVFALVCVAVFAFSLLMYSVNEGVNQPWRLIISVLIFGMLSCFAYFNMTHARINFAYRLSRSGLEMCEWKKFPDWTLPLLKWLAVVMGVIFFLAAVFQPVFIIGALVGPGSMSLMYFQVVNSDGYRTLHTRYHHLVFEWEEITQLAIVTNREIVDVKYHMASHGRDRAREWNCNIFCRRKQKEVVAALIRSCVSPDTPFIRSRLNMLMSTDTHTPIYVGQCGGREGA